MDIRAIYMDIRDIRVDIRALALYILKCISP